MWKVSQYTVARSLSEQGLPSQVLVFNTLSSRCLSVRSADWARILCALDNPEGASEEVRLAIANLVKAGMLVGDETDERERFGASFDAIRQRPKRIFPILAVTTACNIGCTYCYEAGVQGKTMTPEVVAGVLRWLERRVVEDGIREIHPLLFGGEPLLYPKILFRIMDGFNEMCARHGAFGLFGGSSNGMLMTPDLARDLAKRGLTQIQISLDGPEHIHDDRRIGKKGEPSFAQALLGIKAAVEHVHNVTVKVNFDRHNRAAVSALFDRLLEEGLGRKVDIKLEAIALQFRDSKVIHDPAVVIPPESPEMAEAYLGLTLEAEQRGIRVRRDTAHTTPCMFSSHHGVIIGPDGDIHKCISLVGRKELRVGTVLEEGYDEGEYRRQMNTMKRIEDCFEEKCPYIPVCAGGCAYESVVRTGRYDLRFCTKEYLAEYHFKRNLIQHRPALEKLGMKPLSPSDLERFHAGTGGSIPRATGGPSGPTEGLVQIRRTLSVRH
jgi:uncharacterized protein